MPTIQTATKMGMINAALRECLGETAASDETDPRESVQTMVQGFDRIYETLLQSNPWRFSMKKRAAQQLNFDPVNEYSYAFQIPTDCLMLRGVWPRRTNYEVYGDRIYTSAKPIDLEYQYKPEIGALPAYFSSLLVCHLGLAGARVATGKEGVVGDIRVRIREVLPIAQYADAQARPNRPLDDPYAAGNR
jgi:hypothetical protein